MDLSTEILYGTLFWTFGTTAWSSLRKSFNTCNVKSEHLLTLSPLLPDVPGSPGEPEMPIGPSGPRGPNGPCGPVDPYITNTLYYSNEPLIIEEYFVDEIS